jgi:quercetin dioxygenase-like cupin family protein
MTPRAGRLAWRDPSRALAAAGALALLAALAGCAPARAPCTPACGVAESSAPSATLPAATATASAAPDAQSPSVVTPDGVLRPAPWTDEELAKDVALRTLRQTDAASFHLVRIAKSEKPHAHDRSELTIVLLSGALSMHVAGHATPVRPGDVIDVPRGVVHWAENVGPGPSVAYIVFSPAFDGKDRRFVDEPHGP